MHLQHARAPFRYLLPLPLPIRRRTRFRWARCQSKVLVTREAIMLPGNYKPSIDAW